MTEPVVVLGGGPAGAVCARQLACAGVEVVLFERLALPRAKLGETCGPALPRLLAGCGLTVPAGAFRALETFGSSWGSSVLDYRDFSFWSGGHGLVLDRAAFEAWLLEEARTSGVTVIHGDGAQVHESFVVDATGRGARMRIFTDALTAVVMTDQRDPGDPTAMIESCETGWWYAASLPNGERIVALFTDADLVSGADDRRAWLERLYAATTHVRQAGPLPRTGTIRVADARTGIRKVLWRDRRLAIGDAAWCLDPLSGTGIERAVRDGIGAAAGILRALDGDFDAVRAHALAAAGAFGDALVTQRACYAAERRWPDAPFWRRRLAVGC